MKVPKKVVASYLLLANDRLVLGLVPVTGTGTRKVPVPAFFTGTGIRAVPVLAHHWFKYIFNKG